ncbi:hypothetical protein B0H67DRAFT_551606 [Lasiosphaeris hirsuta]|uniref:Uncharacterized protein n=1 Tax=Lasiosphaeris hirsuta TaxID=260670 RepID=A0AA40ANP5_9PEZI|nr:hypothetical protein B0H67DRAFT_551606 [Lasiosphaeris hirsuta]
MAEQMGKHQYSGGEKYQFRQLHLSLRDHQIFSLAISHPPASKPYKMMSLLTVFFVLSAYLALVVAVLGSICIPSTITSYATYTTTITTTTLLITTSAPLVPGLWIPSAASAWLVWGGSPGPTGKLPGSSRLRAYSEPASSSRFCLNPRSLFCSRKLSVRAD